MKTNVTTVNFDAAHIVDELEHLLGLKANLATRERELKAELAEYANGEPEAFEGALFRSTVSFPEDSEVVDWKAIAEHCKPSRQLIQAHTKKRANAPRVAVKARKGA